MKIVIIGSGHVATVLARKMALAGHVFVEVNSRKKENAKMLADELGCGYSSGWESVSKEGDLYLLALSDTALTGIGNRISLQKKVVVHTAGSVSKDVLHEVSTNYGVVYPLQSLRKELKELPEIPFLVDGNTEDDLALIYDFAKTISFHVRVVDDATRSKLHLASVFVNNFTNHLYACAEQYCKQEKLEFSLLLPLIEETAKRVMKFSPAGLQTGPAFRKDEGTVEKQLALLSDYPELKGIYELFTRSIQTSIPGQ